MPTPDIWAACGEAAPLGALAFTALRLVESQEQVATRRLVATLDEQALLEDLLEGSKPSVPDHVQRRAGEPLHYLLTTPFRYPPLRHGSRFGGRFEPSLFYGALDTDTVLAESAYYRLLFWQGMVAPPPRPLRTQHTLFGVKCRCQRAARLQAPPFDAWRAMLTHPADYAATQLLGARLRTAGVDGFHYVSARDPRGGVCVALFTAAPFTERRPSLFQAWLAETDGAGVQFWSAEAGEVCRFTLADFQVDGLLPAPAT